MEAFNRTSVHSLNSLDSLDTLNNINAMSKIETNTETSSSQESLDTTSNQNLPVVPDESQNLEKNELHLEINENKLPENEQTPRYYKFYLFLPFFVLKKLFIKKIK